MGSWLGQKTGPREDMMTGFIVTGFRCGSQTEQVWQTIGSEYPSLRMEAFFVPHFAVGPLR